MRKLTVIFPLAICTLLLAGGQVAGAAGKTGATTTVRVVMHDPGCHWFSVGGKYKTSLSVKGPVVLANFDEAALKITSSHGVKHAAVGKRISLARGTYRITMVGQASDDNTLRLAVN